MLTANAFFRTVARALLLSAMIFAPSLQTAQAQTFKVLYRFTGGADGGEPKGALLLRNGSLYGTTSHGGWAPYPGCCGTVFKIDLTSGQLTTLHGFVVSEGATLESGVIADSIGNLYGTTSLAGASSWGTLYKLAPDGSLTVLHDFGGPPPDGKDSESGLVADSAGNIYGATLGGGNSNTGMIFKLDTSANFSVLYSFTSQPAKTGVNPDSTLDLIRGHLYGSTMGSGIKENGTLFRVDVSTGVGQLLYRFTGGSDGGYPVGGLASDGRDNLYGTAALGGVRPDRGVVFAFNIATRKLTVLHAFTGGPDGSAPFGGLVRDSQGNLYGTTLDGGMGGSGTAFKIDTAGTFSRLHAFKGVGEGAHPMGTLILGPTGKLYGTTREGGLACRCGTVFELVP